MCNHNHPRNWGDVVGRLRLVLFAQQQKDNNMPQEIRHESTWVHRRPSVERQTGLSRSTIYAMMAEGTFPRPIRLGKRAVGWRDSDIAAWLESREKEGDAV